MNWVIPKILAVVTQHPRTKVVAGIDFEWSDKLWVHNIFRVYELVFWRRSGIRLGTSVSIDSTGNKIVRFYTWEDIFAHIEVTIRAAFQFKKLAPFRILRPAYAGMPNPFGVPYLFAIAFDVAAAAGSPPKTAAFTYSHTNTGSNITICVGGGMNAASTTSPTAKYNTVAMTTGSILQNTTSWGFVFYQSSAPTGANTVELDDSVATEWAACSVSLTGTVSTPSSPGTNSAKATSTAPSVTVTTTVANSYVVTAAWCTNTTFGTTTTGTNQTSRTTAQDADSSFSAAISTQTTTTAGGYTSGWTIASALWIVAAIEVQESATASTATVTPQLLVLGVG